MKDREDQEPHSFDEWMRDFVREPTLWPVVIAVAGTFSTMGAALLVLALGDRNLFAMAALAIVVVAGGRGGVLDKLYKSQKKIADYAETGFTIKRIKIENKYFNK